MDKLICFLALLTSPSLLLVKAKTDEEWHKYKEKHKKSYSDKRVERARRNVWEKNHDFIESHNAEAELGCNKFYLGVNKFSDWMPDELRTANGLVIHDEMTKEHDQQEMNLIENKVLPTSVDYGSHPCLGPVFDQGQCGCCWAFVATTTIDYYDCKRKSNNLTMYSRQQLVSCDTNDRGCNGGMYINAWLWTISNYGLCTYRAYPYSSNVTKISDLCYTNCTNYNTVRSYKLLSTNASVIESVVASVGPVAAAVYSDDKFMFYKSGVFENTSCNKTPNHAVVITGYSTMPDGVPYWIIRNAWGTSWGMQGYGFIRRGVNMCGIESYAAYPIV